LLLAPSIILMGVLLGYPLIRLVDTSFQQYTQRELFNRTTVYNGVANYARLLTDDQFLTIVVRTFVVVCAMVVGTMVLGTAIALMLERLRPVMRGAVSIALLLAWATPTISAVQVWKWMFNSQYGIITWLVEFVGINLRGDNSIMFSGWKVLTAITIIVIWQGIPFIALTLYAGLTQVPKELYEAAEMDGAGFWKRFSLVTVPMLRPIFLLLITLSVIWDFRAFNQVWAFNKGGPNGESLLLGSYSYFASFVQYDFGYGAAIAISMVLGLFVLTYYYIRQMVRAGETS
jgi:N,N'-diacetylchitobiose transport system permease protein